MKGAGRGYSSLAIADGRIYTLGDGPSGAPDKEEYLVAFDQKSGQHLWSTKTGPAWNEGPPDWQSSRSTPTVDADRVYVVTPRGLLYCCNSETGEVRWKKDLKADFGGDKADGWGYSESPLIDGDGVICTPGRPEATMVALNKHTGDVIWKASRSGDVGAGHASIVISEIGGTKVYVQSTGSGPFGVRAGDGKVLWEYPIDRSTAVIPTPIVRDDLVFFTAGYGRGGALFRQKPGADGNVTMEVIYPLKPDLGNKHGGVVLVGDNLYGDSDDKGIPYCADLMTGEIKWKSRASGRNSAAIAAADGHLYIRFANGVMVLAKADPKEYVETGSFKTPESDGRPGWAHPVIVDGKLYLRSDDSIFVFDIRAKG
jgi:outer membrane protein assembly factor BamB